jgi:hypothetical protein
MIYVLMKTRDGMMMERNGDPATTFCISAPQQDAPRGSERVMNRNAAWLVDDPETTPPTTSSSK